MSLVESLLALTLFMVVAAMAVPSILGGLDEARGMAAARYLVSLARWARAQAALRSTAVGVRFEPVADGFQFTVHVDGDDDGVRTSDVRRGIDPAIRPAEQLRDRFPGIRIDLDSGTPGVSGEGPAGVDADPVRLGVADTLTFSPRGSATSGTIFIRTRRGRQFAVRILGATGRCRVLALHPVTGEWEER